MHVGLTYTKTHVKIIIEINRSLHILGTNNFYAAKL